MIISLNLVGICVGTIVAVVVLVLVIALRRRRLRKDTKKERRGVFNERDEQDSSIVQVTLTSGGSIEVETTRRPRARTSFEYIEDDESEDDDEFVVPPGLMVSFEIVEKNLHDVARVRGTTGSTPSAIHFV